MSRKVGTGELWLLLWGLLWNNVVLSTHFQVVSLSGIRHLGKLLSRTGSGKGKKPKCGLSGRIKIGLSCSSSLGSKHRQGKAEDPGSPEAHRPTLMVGVHQTFKVPARVS